MAYPPPPGTNSLPARPPVSAAHARPGFKPAFNPIGQPGAPQPPPYASVPPSRATGPTYPAAPAATTQYGSSSYSSTYGGRAAASPAPLNGHHRATPSSYPYPHQRQGYGPQSQHHHYQQHPQQHQQLPHQQHQQPASHHHHQQQHQNHQHHQHHQPQQQQQQQQQQHQQQHQSYGQAAQYSAAPQIRNPFPTPGPAASDYDPEMAAQIAQWQSAYVPRETDRDGRPTAGIEYPKPEVPDAAAQPERKKTVAREGGGKKWKDDSLLEWDPSHLRLFVGNLAGETTDESLLKAFARWKSVQKARVIRDKRTTKSKGFGFVSFSDADDFFQAAKEMNGKYIQSHPVVVKKATTEIKVTNVKDKNRQGKKGNNNSGNKQRGQNQGGDKKKGWEQGGYEPYLGPMAGGGVTKPGQKTKNGLRLLG